MVSCGGHSAKNARVILIVSHFRRETRQQAAEMEQHNEDYLQKHMTIEAPESARHPRGLATFKVTLADLRIGQIALLQLPARCYIGPDAHSQRSGSLKSYFVGFWGRHYIPLLKGWRTIRRDEAKKRKLDFEAESLKAAEWTVDKKDQKSSEQRMKRLKTPSGWSRASSRIWNQTGTLKAGDFIDFIEKDLLYAAKTLSPLLSLRLRARWYVCSVSSSDRFSKK